ncbi:L-glyceraldehyde 3-phosphate reductase [Bacillus weihaiensis]|uniref:L-glyceraldehyde 3-phosphate reductase n=1 Tax=Bacillus weihaiensis TaxID=1547283 RepID=A0A1L3MUK1_9BACI|nr:L-glyceraldehyde 3-phosphate reductase [Bacillus weihaiensis]APH06025.1 L-glyceraldehyde 3-phosphate reductase [Bacillus weihaiensis]
MLFQPNETRYEKMIYNRCGNSGLKLPALSLGLWHNFGGEDSFENGRALIHRAFDLGITHFDLANNYGPPPGSAEETFGRILQKDLTHYRDEMIISTKAGYSMWPGPYGDWGSKKYLVSSLDQSLKRMGLDYVDIFYHHRPDPETPLEETMMALDQLVRQGKALYIGISNYGVEETEKAVNILNELGTPLLINQVPYSMFNREVENGLTSFLHQHGAGCIAFVPLAQGLLTNRYINGIPSDSRAKKSKSFLNEEDVTSEVMVKVQSLHTLAQERGQSLAQMALAWVLRREADVTSALIGASKVSQLEENVAALDQVAFTAEELRKIDDIVNK